LSEVRSPVVSLLIPEAVTYVIARHGLRAVNAINGGFSGELSGVAISLITNANGRSGESLLSATIVPGTDLGLRVRQATGMFDSASSFSVDAEFDGIFQRECDPRDAESARKVLGADVRDALMVLARYGSCALHDDQVRCALLVSMLSGPEFDSALRACVQVATAVDAARRTLAPPAALRHGGVDEGLTRALDGHRVSISSHPFCAVGALDEDAFSLRFVTHFSGRAGGDPLLGASATPGYDVSITFAEPLAGGLRVRPSSWLDRAQSALGIGDLALGDAPFDRAWTVEAQDERAARAQLNARARELLQQLGALGLACSLDARGLSGRGAMLRSAEDAFALVTTLAALRGALRGTVAQGPYR
jgi:hypothetical protein